MKEKRREDSAREEDRGGATSVEPHLEIFEIRVVSTTNRLDANFSQFAVCLVAPIFLQKITKASSIKRSENENNNSKVFKQVTVTVNIRINWWSIFSCFKNKH